MSKNILDKKIPSLAGVGFLVFAAVATTFLVKGPNTFLTNANNGNEPQNIQITNVTDSSFTVTYITEEDVAGTIIISDDRNNLNQLILDDRDQLSQDVNKYSAHSITANNLDSNTEYYFEITSGGKKINNNGVPFNIKTGARITSTPSNQVPIAGSAKDPNGILIDDGLVLVNINGSQLISGVIRENGNYTIPLNNLRTTSLNNYFNIDDNTIIELEIYSNKHFSKISVNSDQLSPVPIVTLSNNFDFSIKSNNSTNLSRSDEIKFPEFDSEILESTSTSSTEIFSNFK